MRQIPNRPFDERSTWQDWERFRRDVVETVNEIARQPGVLARRISNVELADGVTTEVPHGIGRRARVFVSPWGGTATIEEIEGSKPDTFIYLAATGADVTVDLWVVPA